MTYRSFTTPVLSSTTTAVVSAPSGMSNGDGVLLVLANFGGNNGNISSVTVSGPTQLQFDTETFEFSQLWFAWVVAAGQTSWTLTGSRAMTCVASAIAFSGVAASPADGSSIAKDGGTGASSPVSVSASTITTTATGSLIWMWVSAPSSDHLYSGFTVPSGFTQLFSTADSANDYMRLLVGYQDAVAAGATGTKTGSLTLSSGTSGYLAGLAAFKDGTSAVSDIIPSIVAARNGAASPMRRMAPQQSIALF